MPSHETNTQTKGRSNDLTRPNSSKKGTSHKRWRCNPEKAKMRTAGYAHLFLDLSKRMKHQEGKACARPGNHQPIPNHYGKEWGHGIGHGLAVGRGVEIHSCVSCPNSFAGHSPVGMKCHSKEVRLGKNHWVHAMRDREGDGTHWMSRKGTFIVWKSQVNGGGKNHWLGKWSAKGSHIRQMPLRG